jgi:hypothetical protein
MPYCVAGLLEGRSMAIKKIAISQAELESLLLAELRDVTDCNSATRVQIYVRNAPGSDPNWSLANWGIGNCPATKCGNALRGMVARLSELYDAYS